MAIAADQLELITGGDRRQAVPIVLDLVQSAVALQRLGAGRNDLQPDALKQIGRNRAGGNANVVMGTAGAI